MNGTAAALLAAAALAGCGEDGGAEPAPSATPRAATTATPATPATTATPAPARERALTGRVEYVTDGDTVRVRLSGGREERVRYIGIDTPETPKPDAPGECFGDRARAFNAQLVDGRKVRLVRDVEWRDRFGRLLAYVYVGDTLVNEDLLRRGYAEPIVVPPNVRMASRFRQLGREAREAGRGMWASCAS